MRRRIASVSSAPEGCIRAKRDGKVLATPVQAFRESYMLRDTLIFEAFRTLTRDAELGRSAILPNQEGSHTSTADKLVRCTRQDAIKGEILVAEVGTRRTKRR